MEYETRMDKATQGPLPAGKRGLIWIALGPVMAALLALLLAEVVISVTNYRPDRGLFDSPVVGFENYARVLNRPGFLNTLLSTYANGLLSLLMVLVFGFGGMGLSKAGKGGAGVCVAVGLTLAAVPALFWRQLFLTPSTEAASTVLGTALPWAGMAMAGAGLTTSAWPKRSILPALPVALMFLMTLLTGQGNALAGYVLSGWQQMDSFVYRYGLANYQFSVASAATVLRLLAGLLPAVLGMVLLAVFTARVRPHDTVERVRPGFGAALPGMIVAAVVLIAGITLALTGRLAGVSQLPAMISATLVEMLLALVLGFGLGLLALLALGQAERRGSFLFALCVFLAMPVCGFSIVKFLLVRDMELMNTVYPVVLSWMTNPLLLVFLALLAMNRPRRAGEYLPAALAFAAMAVVLGLGNPLPSVLYRASRSGQDVSYYLYSMMMSGAATATIGTTTIADAAAAAAAAAAARRALWGVMAVMAAVPLGIAVLFPTRLTMSRE